MLLEQALLISNNFTHLGSIKMYPTAVPLIVLTVVIRFPYLTSLKQSEFCTVYYANG